MHTIEEKFHAAARLGQNGRIRAQAPPNGFREENAEMFFVLLVSLVGDLLAGIETPIRGRSYFACFESHIRRRRDRTDALVGGDGGRRRSGDPSCKIALVERQRSASKQHQRFQNRTPGDALALTRVEEWSSTAKILGQCER